MYPRMIVKNWIGISPLALTKPSTSSSFRIRSFTKSPAVDEEEEDEDEDIDERAAAMEAVEMLKLLLLLFSPFVRDDNAAAAAVCELMKNL